MHVKHCFCSGLYQLCTSGLDSIEQRNYSVSISHVRLFSNHSRDFQADLGFGPSLVCYKQQEIAAILLE